MATDKNDKPEKDEKPKDTESVHPEPDKDPGTPTAPAIDPEQFNQLVQAVSGVVSDINSLKESVTALANQGSVNESVKQDNSPKEPEYPTIDLDEVNRLLGV